MPWAMLNEAPLQTAEAAWHSLYRRLRLRDPNCGSSVVCIGIARHELMVCGQRAMSSCLFHRPE